LPPDDIQRVDLLNRAIETIYKELGGRASGLPGVQTVAPEADRAGGSRVPLPCPEAKISFVFWMPSINIGRHFVFGVDGFYRRMPRHLLYRQTATELLIHRPANRHSNRPAELGCCNVVADGPAILDSYFEQPIPNGLSTRCGPIENRPDTLRLQLVTASCREAHVGGEFARAR
jgi:hypothetical protein